MSLPAHNFGPSTEHLETQTAEVAGVKGEVLILLHHTPKGDIYEVVFAGEIATEPVFIGEAFAHKPTPLQIELFKTRGQVHDYITKQKELRQGWN